MTSTLRLPWLLATLLLSAQFLLAWHAPSHIDAELGHVQSVQECQLGGQAHAPGLPSATLELAQVSSQAIHQADVESAAPVCHRIAVLARGPPALLI